MVKLQKTNCIKRRLRQELLISPFRYFLFFKKQTTKEFSKVGVHAGSICNMLRYRGDCTLFLLFRGESDGYNGKL